MYEAVSVCGFVQVYILQFFRAVIDQQTWSDSGSVSERRLRSEVLALACHLDDPPCTEQAGQRFKEWLQSNGTLRSVIIGQQLCFVGPYNLIFCH